MALNFVFVDRRETRRRLDADPCRHLPLDLCHRKRRKSVDRRTTAERTQKEDTEAYLQSALENWEPATDPTCVYTSTKHIVN
jgi:hypothetical protein